MSRDELTALVIQSARRRGVPLSRIEFVAAVLGPATNVLAYTGLIVLVVVYR
jgi:hypothetical protein